jgi:hypothetical protein
MTDHLEILARAIPDVGYWRWWVAELPEVFQIEFGGVQLWCPPTAEGEPPCGIVALRFAEPVSVVFLTLSEDLPDDWIQRLHDDKLEPFDVSEGLLSFNDERLLSDVLQKAVKVDLFHGAAVDSEQFRRARFRLSFAAEGVGLVLAGDTMHLHTSAGLVQVHEVEEMSRKWWEYWKDYWRLRRTDQPLPKDYACEVTIPIAGSTEQDKQG